MKIDTKPMAFDLSGVSVMIGIPCGPELPWQTVKALMETVMMLKDKGIPFDVRMVAGCSIVQKARNQVAEEFLKSGMNRLFMIDSDMYWEAKDFLKLLALSTKMRVVAAAYPAKTDVVTFMLGDQDFSALEMNEFGCLPINGLGLGFTVADRDVIECLAEYSPSSKSSGQRQIFRCEMVDGEFRGEDISFFSDVRSHGFDVNLDPTICLGHIGNKMYTGSIMDAMKTVTQ